MMDNISKKSEHVQSKFHMHLICLETFYRPWLKPFDGPGYETQAWSCGMWSCIVWYTIWSYGMWGCIVWYTIWSCGMWSCITAVFATRRSLLFSVLKMETTRSVKTVLTTYHTIQCHISDDDNVNIMNAILCPGHHDDRVLMSAAYSSHQWDRRTREQIWSPQWQGSEEPAGDISAICGTGNCYPLHKHDLPSKHLSDWHHTETDTTIFATLNIYIPLAALSMVDASVHCCVSMWPNVYQRG
jgi:hypothetical protein